MSVLVACVVLFLACDVLVCVSLSHRGRHGLLQRVSQRCLGNQHFHEALIEQQRLRLRHVETDRTTQYDGETSLTPAAVLLLSFSLLEFSFLFRGECF